MFDIYTALKMYKLLIKRLCKGTAQSIDAAFYFNQFLSEMYM